jgi:RHS repeat-associated protein
MVSSTGQLQGSIQDYAPFGQLFNGSGTNDPYKFTGKERDSESGNDYFGARYYASSMGRWLSPDWSVKAEPVPYGKLLDPQSLNLYSYVENNPLRSPDPDGHVGIDHEFDALSCLDPQHNAECTSVSHQKTLVQIALENNAIKWAFVANSFNAYWAGQAEQAQQQNSNGGGFWSGLKHGFSNLFHGHSWGYVKATVTDTETYSIKAEPNQAITFGSDAAGLVANATKNTPLGVVGAAASVANDHGAQNVTTNVLGFVPGYGWPTAIIGTQ